MINNRGLIWITIAAISLAALAIHFHASKNIAASQNSDAIPDDVFFDTLIRLSENSQSSRATINQTDRTLAQLRDLLAQDPSDQGGHAAELLIQQCRDKQFPTALALVDAVPRDLRSDWLKIIFNWWAQVQPEDAMKALDRIGDPDEWAAAFHAAINGWNATDPAGLANYAFKLPASDERNDALSAALENWSLQDPTALGAWLNTLPRGAEYDYGVALMLSKTDGANRSSELAMKWVENIGDPALKQSSFDRVIAEWLQSDSAAAKQYVANATWLDDVSRSKILSAQ